MTPFQVSNAIYNMRRRKTHSILDLCDVMAVVILIVGVAFWFLNELIFG